MERQIGTYLYGRGLYETMADWQTIGADPGAPSEAELSSEEADFAELWRAADKVVYSRTLDEASTPNTRLERDFDPDAVRQMKDGVDSDLSIGGPELARHAFRAGLIDEVHLLIFPIVVGSGKPALPHDVRIDLDLIDERRFAGGAVHLRYRAR